ncbi:MAG: protein kinase [Bryobacterales bacterium]|nr:protein kinase [Bryobacterales bacterium]
MEAADFDMTDGNTWNRVEDLFNEALTLPEADRAAWVRNKCGADSAARDQVLQLLGARQDMGDFLQAPMLDFRGQTFGPYRAVEEIGRGGMSVVYRGERTDGDFAKCVAIKVILIQSHAAMQHGETQILAALEHHNIARLIDAGTSGLGFRFLLMEYVEGKPCTEYSAALNETQKLRLFLQMCAGVQYAHRSLIVHRDLKPDNILITADGVVKLLDFGIAKMLRPDAAEAQTVGVQAYTMDYASPEQILGLPVTTSTDIYSLGILLCEMMGRRRPRSFTGLSLGDVVAKAQAEEVTAIPMQGDLAVIAGKALRRDPAERYESAGALARDVERYLDGMPIEAREPTWGYRAGKFIARNKLAVGAATLAVAALAVTTGVAIWQARLASTRFEQVRRLARSVMFELHDAVLPLPGSLGARKLIVDRSLEYLDALARDTNASEDVQLDVARGFLRLSEIQGKDFGGASLGRSGDALARALQAIEVARRLCAGNPGNVAAQRVLIDGLDYATTAYTLRGEAAKAIPLGQEAVMLAEKLVAANPANLENKERLAFVTKQLAAAYQGHSSNDKAIPLFKRNVELRQALYDEDPDSLKRQQRLAEAHQWIGSALYTQKDYPGAGAHAREALRLDEARLLKDPRNARANVAGDAVLLAVVERRAGHMEQAVSLLQRALTMRLEIAAEDPKSVIAALRVASAKDRLADTYRDWGRYPDAIRLGEEALGEARRLQKLDPANVMANREVIFSSMDLALSYEAVKNRNRACALAKETLEFVKGPVKGLGKSVDKQVAQATKLDASCRN